MRTGAQRVTKKKWYELGGFKNSRCVRKHNGRSYEYYYYPD